MLEMNVPSCREGGREAGVRVDPAGSDPPAQPVFSGLHYYSTRRSLRVAPGIKAERISQLLFLSLPEALPLPAAAASLSSVAMLFP